jgi:uncharacterized protein (TIGR03086 family)
VCDIDQVRENDSMTSDTVTLLGRAVSQTGAVIAAIPASMAGARTPCESWNVEELVHHVVGQAMPNFVVAARGDKPDWQAPARPISEDWAADYDALAVELLDAWEAVDLTAQPQMRVHADQQMAELAMHSWDLAKATGQPVDKLDAELAAHSLSWSHGMLRPEYRGEGRGFGLEVPVPEDAPVQDRLAGWFGRDPQWTP